MAKTPEGTYKCECGKEFLKSQSINAHYSRCKVHRGEKYVARSNDPFKNLSILERQAIYEKRDLHNRGRTLSEDHKTKISIGLENAEKSENWGGYREGTNKWKGGKYKDVWMDSSWEIRFAIAADKFGIEWKKNRRSFPYEYEEKKKRYTPDFYLPLSKVWVEVKGWEREVDHAKWSAFPHQLAIVREKELVEFEEKGQVAEWYTRYLAHQKR